MAHLFPDVDVDLKSCRGGLVKFLFSKPLHWFLIVLLCVDVLLVITGRSCNMLQPFSTNFCIASNLVGSLHIFVYCSGQMPGLQLKIEVASLEGSAIASCLGLAIPSGDTEYVEVQQLGRLSSAWKGQDLIS